MNTTSENYQSEEHPEPIDIPRVSITQRFHSTSTMSHRLIKKLFRTSTRSEVNQVASNEDSYSQTQPSFPSGFIWGVGTSAYQVEGAIENNDWHIFTTTPSIRSRIRKLSSFVGDTIELEPAGEAVRHRDIDILKQDLDRVKLLGANAYRFSIEWSRIQPHAPKSSDSKEENFDADAIAYYESVIEEITIRDLTPIVTLYHLSLPQWVLTPPTANGISRRFGIPLAVVDDGFKNSLLGWETEETIQAFIRYVEFVVGRFKDQVKWWIVLNEPVGSVVGLGYIAGVWPPGFSFAPRRAQRAYFNLIKAHVCTYHSIKHLDPEAKVGVAHVMLATKIDRRAKIFTAAFMAFLTAILVVILGTQWHLVELIPVGIAVGFVLGILLVRRLDLDYIARSQFEYFYNEHFLNAVVLGQFDASIRFNPRKRKVLTGRDLQLFYGANISEIEPWQPKLDFIGVNYYRSAKVFYNVFLSSVVGYSGGGFHNNLHQSKRPHLLLNDLGWEICPEGLYRILAFLHRQYKAPILITENGIPETVDRTRAPFIIAHLQQITRVLEDINDIRILGYTYWTLLDNWELQEGYRPEGRFGLFTVDRSDKEQRRYITEGAVAFQQIVADNGLRNVLQRYGTISRTGKHVELPRMSSGNVWEGSAVGSFDFQFHFSLLDNGNLIGMIYDFGSKNWKRLSEIKWSPEDRKLTFSVNSANTSLGQSIWCYEAEVLDSQLQGLLVKEDGSQHEWKARKVHLHGQWSTKSEIDWLKVCNFCRLGEKWFGKLYYPYGNARWLLADILSYNGNDVSWRGMISTEELFFQFTGTLTENLMSGSVIINSRRNISVTRNWEAQRIDDGLPF